MGTPKISKTRRPAATGIGRAGPDSAAPAQVAGTARAAAPDVIFAIGRRKTAVARVRLYLGQTATNLVNDQPMAEYFRPPHLLEVAVAPLVRVGKADVHCTVKVFGGGWHSQAEAVRHGLARALVKHDPTLRASLKPQGWLSRDPRMKERKKPGLRRARRAPQWAKR